MFCPKCGTENPDTNKFCRSCRESLQLVAQAMKKRLPVMIVSKLDAALERLSERFRRDSIIWLILGVGMLIAAAVDFGWRPTSILIPKLLSATVGFLFSGWSFLLYKRSLTLGERLESGEFVSGTETPTPQLQVLFCPACGAETAGSLKHCRSCGANLHVVRAAVKPSRWRLMLNSMLDKGIEKHSDKSKIREKAYQMIWMPIIFLAIGALDIYKDRNPTYLLLGCAFLVIVLWDLAASRRWFPTEEKRGDESQAVPTDRLSAPTTDELALPSAPTTFPMSITEETTRRLEPVLVQSQEEAKTRKL